VGRYQTRARRYYGWKMWIARSCTISAASGSVDVERQRRLRDQLGHVGADHVGAEEPVGLPVGDDLDPALGARAPSLRRRGHRASYAAALSARDVQAVCLATGREIDQWLFWQTNTTGGLNTAAKWSPAWKSSLLVAPAPR
jgi:hypothetical protein